MIDVEEKEKSIIEDSYMCFCQFVTLSEDIKKVALLSILQDIKDQGFLNDFLELLYEKKELDSLDIITEFSDEISSFKHSVHRGVHCLKAGERNWHDDLYDMSCIIRDLQKHVPVDSEAEEFLHKCLYFPVTISNAYISDHGAFDISDSEKKQLSSLKQKMEIGLNIADIPGALSEVLEIFSPLLKSNSRLNLINSHSKIEERGISINRALLV